MIMSREEKYGGTQNTSSATKEFKNWAESNMLIDIPTKNGIYTWNNRRKDFNYITERLDRFLVREYLSKINMEIQA